MYGHCTHIMYFSHAIRIYGNDLKFIDDMCRPALQLHRCVRSIVSSKHV